MIDTLAEYQAIADNVTRCLRLPRVLIEWKHRNNDYFSNRGYYLPGLDTIRLNLNHSDMDTLRHELAHHVAHYKHNKYGLHGAPFKECLAALAHCENWVAR